VNFIDSPDLQKPAHGLAVGSTALVKTDGIGAARLDKAARPSQPGEAARLYSIPKISKDTFFEGI